MCPAYRKDTIEDIKQKLPVSKNLICVSTQIIEAGVDISFDCAIRLRAGMDSIIQAAGRCNRNGASEVGNVYVLTPTNESDSLAPLPDILCGSVATRDTVHYLPPDADAMSPNNLKDYYVRFLKERENKDRDILKYPIKGGNSIRNAAPLAGAWIERKIEALQKEIATASHPLRVCGLKGQ